jgi:hypothetical protein
VLRSITLAKQIQVEAPLYTPKKPHIASIALDVAIEFCQGKIVGIKRHQAQS